MVDDRNNAGAAGEFSDDTIRRFLLGQLSEAERPAFEEQFLIDARLAARVRLAEFELTDEFVFQQINAADQKVFRQKFLASAGRRQQLMVSAALHDRFAANANFIETKPTFSLIEWLKLALSPKRHARRYAIAGVILLLLLSSAWLFVSRAPRVPNQIVERLTGRKKANPNGPSSLNHPANTSPPNHLSGSPPGPDHNQTSPSAATVSVTLSPETRDENLAQVNPPTGVQDIVRIALILKPNQTGSFRAELLTSDGQEVVTFPEVKPDALDPTMVSLDVSARLLVKGDYQIKLSSNEAVSWYYFRVQ